MSSQKNDQDATVLLQDVTKAIRAEDKETLSKPAFLVVIGGDLNDTLFDLQEGETTVGRNAENSIPLDFLGISRNHFSIKIAGDTATLKDLGSSNGTYLNNQRIDSEQVLHKGDMIKLGMGQNKFISLKFFPAGSPERRDFDELHTKASTDGLTKCFNKAYFTNTVDLEVKKSKVTGNPLSLIIIDLDHFKLLNDNHGHDAGDYVLVAFSQLVRENGIREGDTFARWGGEEFCIVLPKTNIKQAFIIAERLRRLVEEFPFRYNGGERLKVTGSFGIADYRKGVNSGNDLFKRADTAVYDSKQNGRNRVSYYVDPK